MASLKLNYLIRLYLLCSLGYVAVANGVPSVNDAVTVARFLNYIGSSLNKTTINIIYNKNYYKADYINELFMALHNIGNKHFAERPVIVRTKVGPHFGQFYKIVNTSTLFVLFIHNTLDKILNATAAQMRGRRGCHTIFILQKNLTIYNELYSFFHYIWLKQYTMPLALTANKKLYTIKPYPKLHIEHVSKWLWSKEAEHLFPQRYVHNLMGYEIDVNVQLNVPSTFLYFIKNSKDYILCGEGGTIFAEFMRHLNVTVYLKPLHVNGSINLNMEQIIEQIQKAEVEISPHLYTTLHAADNIDYSYPFKMVPRCFMLPQSERISPTLYVLLAFNWRVWLCLAVLTLFIVGVLKILFKFSKIMHQETAASQNVPSTNLVILCTLLGLPANYGSELNRRHDSLLNYLRVYVISITVMFGGFVIAQTYSTKLKSYFIFPAERHLKDITLKFLFNYGKSILINRDDAKSIIAALEHETEFRTVFQYANDSDFYEQRVNMNSDYIYPISTERWNFVNLQQRYLVHKRFQFTNLCYGTFPYQYQMRIDSHFKEPLNRFILHVYESGLDKHWRADWYRRAMKMGYVHDFDDIANYSRLHAAHSLSLEILSSPIYLYIVGLLVSFNIFVAEILYFKRVERRR